MAKKIDRVALLVGIDNYPGQPLSGCGDDAEMVANAIRYNDDSSSENENSLNFVCTVLKDPSDKKTLAAAIKKNFDNNNDVALFYFSGHGYVDSTGGYLVTPDSDENDAGLPMATLLNIVNNSPATNKIIILDCCQAGGAGNSAVGGGGNSEIHEGVVILSSSGARQSSLQVNGQGLFTNLLLDALNGAAANVLGQITPGSIYAYIDVAMGPVGQRPVFKANVSSFNAVRYVKPSVPLGTLRNITRYFEKPKDVYALDPSYEESNAKDYPIEKRGEPTAEHIKIFKELQKYVTAGLLVPVGEQYMYYAAQNSAACALTPLGHHYWKLVKEGYI